MTFQKITILIAILVSGCVVYSQGSTIEVQVENDTQNYTYECTATFYQNDAVPTSGSVTFIVTPGNTAMETYEFDDTDICLERLKCETDEEGPIGNIYVDCGQGLNAEVDIAPWNNSTSDWYRFMYTTYNYYGATEDHYFKIRP